MARRFGSAPAASTSIPASLKQRFERKKTQEIDRLRHKGWKLMDAVRAARTSAAFDILSDDFVKLEPVSENEPYDDSYIDTWTDRTPRQREKDRKELRERIGNEGTWGLVSYWRPNPRASWDQVDAVGGFVGDDWKDSGYDVDLMNAALRAVARGTKGIPAQMARMGLHED